MIGAGGWTSPDAVRHERQLKPKSDWSLTIDEPVSTGSMRNNLVELGEMIMRAALIAIATFTALASQPAQAKGCSLSPRDVATHFMTEFYTDKKVRQAFERWVDPGYIQHSPGVATGRDAAIAFLEPFAANPGVRIEIKRVIVDGPLVAVHSHVHLNAEDRGLAVIDILRIKGCKVMEHWDVVQPVPENAANSNGMF